MQTYGPRSVLDAGCGTGRVAVELARRGVDVVGVDSDPDMIDAARAKSPDLRWILADLAELALPDRFDVVVLAGNVVPYVDADRRAAAVTACARHLAPGGVLVAGFALRPGWPGPRRLRRMVRGRRAHPRRPLGHLGPAALRRRRLRRLRAHLDAGSPPRRRSLTDTQVVGHCTSSEAVAHVERGVTALLCVRRHARVRREPPNRRADCAA